MNSLKKIILSVLTLSTTLGVSAQNFDEKAIVKAMEEELNRNLSQLTLPNADKPFYMSYTLGVSERIQISASYGAITNQTVEPIITNMTNVQLVTGNYDKNSEVMYGMPLVAGSASKYLTVDGIKRQFWGLSDNSYKATISYNAQKQNYLMQNPLTGELATLPEMQKLDAVTSLDAPSTAIDVNMDEWRENVRKLSAIFNNYKEIDNSTVTLGVSTYNAYKVTSEGVKIKAPHYIAELIVSAMSTTKEGETVSDNMQIFKTSLADFPTMDKLEEQINKFAKGLIEYTTSEYIDSRYSGPVMFEGGAVLAILNTNMFGKERLAATRPQIGRQLSSEAFGRRIGKEVVSSNLTVKNYTNLKEYNGEKLIGGYSIDADGVTPPAELTLIENGVVKNLLNGRTPTVGAPKSTGSARWSVLAQYAQTSIAPAIVHYQVTKATKDKSMKKALIKLAKKEKKEYAYIVRSMSQTASKIYRINVKTGEEQLMRGATVDNVTLDKLMDIAAFSASEKVANILAPTRTYMSCIYPSSMILKSADIVSKGDVKAKTEYLKSPLKR